MNRSNRQERRVLIIVENLPVPFDRRVWSEATTLRDAGYLVSIICPIGKGAEKHFEEIDGIEVFRHPLPFEASRALGYLGEYAVALFWEFVLSLKVIRRRGFDVVHACNPPDLIFLIGAFYKYLFGKRFVFDHHDINPELYEAKFGRRDFLWRLLVLLERLTFRVADISIATNESYRRIAIERGGMNPNKVFIVRSGPDLRRLRPMPIDSRWKNGRPYLVAYVGVIGEPEGIDLLLKATDHIRQQGRNDVQIVIVGSGPQLEPMKELAVAMGLSDRVTFTGRVDDATLLSVLSTADVCVNPDRPNPMNDKSTMNKVMEYMALSKPIVQFDLTEGRYSAQNSSLYARNTDVADFGDKILELLDAPARREEMGRIGRERVEKVLSWPHEAPRLLKAYETVFERTRRVGRLEAQVKSR